jgi:hypothetical protein
MKTKNPGIILSGLIFILIAGVSDSLAQCDLPGTNPCLTETRKPVTKKNPKKTSPTKTNNKPVISKPKTTKVPKEKPVKSKASIIFEERFNDNKLGWYTASGSNSIASITDNSYLFELKTAGWIFGTRPIAIDESEDFVIEAAVKKKSGEDNNGYGLIWGLNDTDNFYTFLLFGDSSFGVYNKKSGKYIDVISKSVTNSINKMNLINKLKIEKKADKLRFYINSAFVGSADFEEFYGNWLGFVVYEQKTVAFDDLVITQVNKQ